jgi:large subunit ribosomal protein L37Ae
MGSTKKVGITGRYGPRYGSIVRKRVKKIEERMKLSHKCPMCRNKSVKRISAGIWHCRKCNITFTGGAYIPMTDEGKKAFRTVKRVRSQTS